MLTLPRLVHTRETLNENDMLMLLNFELSAYDECSDCRFTAVKPSIRDETGSNWRGARVKSGCALNEAARSIARQVLHEVHDEYNLE